MTDPGPPRGSWYIPLVALVLFIGSVGSAHDDQRRVLPAAGIAGIASACLLLVRFRPRSSVLTAGAAVGLYFALDLPNGPLFVVVPFASFVAAQRVRRPWAVLVAALFPVLAGLGLRVSVHDVNGFVTVWQGVGVSALTLGAGLAGLRLTERHELRAEQARRSATEEQLRIAQGLHDGVGHGLAVIAMHAQVAMHVLDRGSRAPEDDVRLRQSLDAIRSASQDSLDALRRELAVMSSGPTARSPGPGLADLSILLDRVRSGGLAVDLPTDVHPALAVPDEIGQVVYAVVQESLTNVLRHARARRAVVSLRLSGGRFTVTVADDGDGCTTRSSTGTGIAGLRARVERLGGKLEIPTVSSGFVVTASLPVPS